MKNFLLRWKKRKNSKKLTNNIKKIITYNGLLAEINEKFRIKTVPADLSSLLSIPEDPPNPPEKIQDRPEASGQVTSYP